MTDRMRTTEVRRVAGASKILLTGALLTGACAMGSAQIVDGTEAFLPNPVRVLSTTPANGDQNPYGLAFVPATFLGGSGPLRRGDLLVSNYNNKNNLQGTGSTIMRIPANGAKPSVFYQGATQFGPSTGLGVLQYGFVLTCSAPTTDGTAATARAGGILVLNNMGKLITTITDKSIDGPWDMAVVDGGDVATLFVTNAISGTVVRVRLAVTQRSVTATNIATIASGYAHKADPVTLFDAPTGLVYDWRSGILYVASTLDNVVFGVPDALATTTNNGPGRIIYDDPHLRGALGMAAAPNGHLLVTNNDAVNSYSAQPSELIEFTKSGDFVKQISIDPAQGGSFGVAVQTNNDGTATLAAVDDNTASVILWTLPL